MACINKNIKDFQDLEKATKLHPDILAGIISIWQNQTGKIGEFPTIKEILEYEITKKAQNTQNKEASELTKELTDLKDKGLSEEVDRFFTLVSDQIKLMKYASFEDIRNIFKNPLIGSDFKVLFDTLKAAALKTDEGVAFEKKVRGFAVALQQLETISSKFNEDIKNRDFTGVDNKETLKEIMKYYQFLDDYEQLVNELQDKFDSSEPVKLILGRIAANVKSAKTKLFNKEQSSVIEEIASEVSDVYKLQKETQDKEINRLEKLKDNAQKAGRPFAQYDKRIEEVKKEFAKTSVSKEDVADIILGKKGDTGFFYSKFMSWLSTPDAVTDAVNKQIDKAKNDVDDKMREQDLELQKQLSPLLEQLGFNRMSPYDFWKGFVTEAKSLLNDGKDWMKYQFMHEFKGDYEYKLQTLNTNLEKAKKEGDKEAEAEIKKEIFQFKRDYMYQEFSDVYYDRFEVFNTPLGQEAKQQRDDIFEKMNDLATKISNESSIGLELSQDEYDEMDTYLRELRQLSSLYDINGKPKTGKELELAKIHKDYSDKTKNIVEWVPIEGAFQRARDNYENAVRADNSLSEEEIKEKLDTWDANNTRIVYKPDFYKDRKIILTKLEAISKLIKDKTDNSKVISFTETWDKIFEQLKGYRDDNNQINGELVSEGKKLEIKKLQEDLQKLKDGIEGLSGLSPEESEELSKIWALKNNNIPLTADQIKRKKEIEDKRKSLGVSDTKKEEFYSLIEDLMSMQTRIATTAYVGALNSVTAPLGYNFDAEQASKLAEDKETLNKLLKDPTFKSWFEINHLPVKKWDAVNKIKYDSWERLYIWSSIVPVDEDKYVEKTTLKDGTEIKGLPSLKYYRRKVKDQFTTKREIGVTTDNKGNWLPKGYTKSGRFIAKDKTYINEEYYNLKNSSDPKEQAKFKALEILKQLHLKNQEGQNYADKLWMDVPRFTKQSSEIVRSEGAVKASKQHIKDKLNIFHESYKDEDVFNQKQVRTDAFGKEVIQIPVKGKGKIDIDDVSLNLPKSVLLYGESLAMKDALSEIHPLIKSLKNVLSKHGYSDESKFSTNLNKLLNFFRGKLGQEIKTIENTPVKSFEEYRRLGNISDIERRRFQGEVNGGILFENESTASKAVQNYLIAPITKLAAVGTLSFDYVGAMVNSLTGNSYGFLQAIDNPNFTVRDYLSSEKDYFKNVLPDVILDTQEKLGEKSFYGQLIDLINPQIHTSSKLGDKFETNFSLSALSSLKDALINPRQFGEHQIAVTTMLAVLKNTRLLLNSNTIKFQDAYEIKDGVIKLKDGVTNLDGSDFTKNNLSQIRAKVRKAIEDAQGNYASWTKTEAEKYVFGRILFFMRRYLIPLAMDSFGSNRYSGVYGSQKGYTQKAFSVFRVMLSGISDRVNNWDTISPDEKKATLKAMIFSASTGILLLLIKGLYGSDDDDKEKWKKTRNWDYTDIQLMLLLMKFKSELEQFTIFGGYNNISQTFNNPFMIGRKASQFGGLMDALLFKWGEDATYSDKGGWKKMMKAVYGTDSKALINFYKLIGYRGGGIKGQIPGTQESKDVAAYRLKTFTSMQKRN